MGGALKMTTGQRIRLLRTTLNQSRPAFGELTGIEFHRLGNIENGNIRAADDVLEPICRTFPELTNWLIFEGEISRQAIKNSKEAAVRLFFAQIDAATAPTGFDDKLVD